MTETTHPIIDEIRQTAPERNLIGRTSAVLQEAIQRYMNVNASAVGLLDRMERNLIRTVGAVKNGEHLESIVGDDYDMAQTYLVKRAMLFEQISGLCWALSIDRDALFAEIESL